jgi:hypothetical protein
MTFLDAYRNQLGVRRFVSRRDLTPGKVVQFTYDGEQKYAMVLNPDWEGKMHALSLQTFTPDSLQEMFELTKGESDERIIYDKFKNSAFVGERPYRTYLLSKVSTLREVYIKKAATPTEVVKEVAGEEAITQDTPLRVQSTDMNMYGD